MMLIYKDDVCDLSASVAMVTVLQKCQAFP